MKKVLKVLAIVLSLVMISSIPVLASPDYSTISGDYVMRVGIPTGGKHYSNYNVEQFKEIVEEKSGGHITVEIYPSGQWGTVVQCCENCLDGTLEAISLPAAYLATYAPAISVLELPFLFDESIGVAEHSYQILNAGTSLDSYLESKGFVVGAWIRSGDNYILSTSPIESVADMAGKKIRCHTSNIVQETMKAIGAVPTMVDTADLATSLSNGTIDATESDPSFVWTQKYYEQANNYLKMPLRPNQLIFAFSEYWFSSLPEDVQACIKESAQEAVALEHEYCTQMMENVFTQMEEAGVNIIDPDESFVSELKEMTNGIADIYVATNDECAAMYEEFSALVK